MQLTYAGSVAANSIFFAYTYVVVNPEHYAIATAGVYACYHGGNFLASMAGELLVRHTDVGRHLVTLFYLSWVSTSIACVMFVTLVPKPILRPPVSIFSILRGRDTPPSTKEATLQLQIISPARGDTGTGASSSSSSSSNSDDVDDDAANDLAAAAEFGLAGVLGELRQVYSSRYRRMNPFGQ